MSECGKGGEAAGPGRNKGAAQVPASGRLPPSLPQPRALRARSEAAGLDRRPFNGRQVPLGATPPPPPHTHNGGAGEGAAGWPYGCWAPRGCLWSQRAAGEGAPQQGRWSLGAALWAGGVVRPRRGCEGAPRGRGAAGVAARSWF